MKEFERDPLSNAAWEITKKQFPEWTAPKTFDEGLSDEEKNEDIDYPEGPEE